MNEAQLDTHEAVNPCTPLLPCQAHREVRLSFCRRFEHCVAWICLVRSHWHIGTLKLGLPTVQEIRTPYCRKRPVNATLPFWGSNIGLSRSLSRRKSSVLPQFTKSPRFEVQMRLICGQVRDREQH